MLDPAVREPVQSKTELEGYYQVYFVRHVGEETQKPGTTLRFLLTRQLVRFVKASCCAHKCYCETQPQREFTVQERLKVSYRKKQQNQKEVGYFAPA